MFAIVLLAYTKPLDEVLAHVDEHRSYLRTLHSAGKLIASGPFQPRTGGALIVNVANEGELQEIIKNDPFFIRALASYDARVWVPAIGEENLLKTPNQPSG